MSSQWPRYPPCVSDSCSDPECCALGYKFAWPELVGRKAEEAKAIIEKENPSVTAVVLLQGAIGLQNFCCNRVHVYRNPDGIVSSEPRVG